MHTVFLEKISGAWVQINGYAELTHATKFEINKGMLTDLFLWTSFLWPVSFLMTYFSELVFFDLFHSYNDLISFTCFRPTDV